MQLGKIQGKKKWTAEGRSTCEVKLQSFSGHRNHSPKTCICHMNFSLFKLRISYPLENGENEILLPVQIEMGSTNVRVGSTIFGAR